MVLDQYQRERGVFVQTKLKPTKPMTDEALWHWIRYVLGYQIAWRPACQEHDAPFQFIADIVFGRVQSAALHGARGGGKTTGLSIAHLVNGHFDEGFGTSHVGAVMRQANLCYGYFRDYMKDPYFRQALEADPMMTQTRWKNGSLLEILPGTIGATSGPHRNRGVFDEFDLSTYGVYQQFVGMAMSTERYPAQAIYTSAMVTSHGLMARLIDERAERGLRVYKTCLHGDSLVSLPGGKRRIADLVRQQYDGPVITLMGSQLVEGRVIGWYEVPLGERKWVTLRFERYKHMRRGGRGRQQPKLVLTDDHPVLTPDGWREAGQLVSGDSIVTEEAAASQAQEQLICGALLGDASLGQGYFRMGHGRAQEEWLRLKVEALGGFDWRWDDAQPASLKAYTQRSGYWRKARQCWYPEGKKVVDREMAERCFGALMLAVWYADDGWVSNAKRGGAGAVISTEGFNEPDVRWLVALLSRHGYSASRQRAQPGRYRIAFDRAGSERLFQSIAPYLPTCLRYKLRGVRTKGGNRWGRAERAPLAHFQAGLWRLPPAVRFVDSVLVEDGDSRSRALTYCLDVGDTHMFFTSGLAVHNCIFDVMKPCPTCEDAERVKRGVKMDPPSCPLWNDCQGRARFSTGHISREDVIAKRLALDDETWQVQFLCERTGRKGLVYEKWEDGGVASNVTEEAEYKPEYPVIWLCLERQARVQLANGKTKAIADMVRDRDPGPVMSLENGRVVAKSVIGWHKTPLGGRQWVGLRFPSGGSGWRGRKRVVWVTDDHLVLMPDGWREAGELRHGDLVVTEEPTPSIEQQEVIAGTMLGDGSLVKASPGRRGRLRLQLMHAASQREWLDAKRGALAGLGISAIGFGERGQRVVQLRGEAFTARAVDRVYCTTQTLGWLTERYTAWYRRGRKIVNREAVEAALGPRMLAVWFLDDGCLHGKAMRFATHGFNEGDVRWLAALLTEKGYTATVQGHRGGLQIYVRAKAAERLLGEIAPFVPPSMRYKLGHGNWPVFNDRLWRLPAGPRWAAPVELHPGRRPGRRPAYCIDVADTHMFFAGSIALHNCDDGYSPDPLVILAANEMPNGDLHVFDELYVTQFLYEQALELVHGRAPDAAGREEDTWPWHEIAWSEETGPRRTGEVRQYKKPVAAYCGTTDKQLQAHIAKLGVAVKWPRKTGVIEGVGLVRKMICDANGHRGVLVHPRCRNVRREMQFYHRRQLAAGMYSEEPGPNSGRSNPDDGCDCIRVFASARHESQSQRLEPAFPER